MEEPEMRLARVNTHVHMKLYQDNLQFLVGQQTRRLVLAKEGKIWGPMNPPQLQHN